MAYPQWWSPISCRSSAGQGKFAGQRPTFYHCATPPTATTTTTSITSRRDTYQLKWPVSSTPREPRVSHTTASASLLQYTQRRISPGWLGSQVLAYSTQAQKSLGSNRSRDAVLGKLFTPFVPLFTKQQNW